MPGHICVSIYYLEVVNNKKMAFFLAVENVVFTTLNIGSKNAMCYTVVHITCHGLLVTP